MTPADLRTARATLGQMWGLNRLLHMSEMGEALGLQGRDPGRSVRDWERGHTPISGPVMVAVQAMLAGFRPAQTTRASDPDVYPPA
jgi:hypothetical protein